jgi:hypothetical protein
MAVTLNANSSTGFIATSDTSGVLQLQTGGTTAVTVDASQNVGIGITPSAWSAGKAIEVGFAGRSLWGFTQTVGYLTTNAYYNSGFKYGGTGAATLYEHNAGIHAWYNAVSGTAGNAISFGDAKMTLDASGNLLVGKTAQSPTTAGIEFVSPAVSGSGITITSAQSTNLYSGFQMYSTGAAAYRFYVTFDGKINATNTTIAGISDQRLKENIRDLDDGLNTVMALKPRKFDWKEGKGADTKNARGFIAQEFETVFPDLIDEWKDPAPEGEDPYKSVRADLIPVLVKAIQEQQALITQLQADVAALKGASA